MSAPTGVPRSAGRPQTYLPRSSNHDELIDFAAVMRDLELHLADHTASRAALVDPSGTARPIPDELFQVLEQVANALAAGQGITVIPHGTSMTTQQAADFLGISRPTVVRLLESGQIPFDKPGRHRRVRLADLVDYQKTFHAKRREALRSLAASSMDSAVRVGDPKATRRLAETADE